MQVLAPATPRLKPKRWSRAAPVCWRAAALAQHARYFGQQLQHAAASGIYPTVAAFRHFVPFVLDENPEDDDEKRPRAENASAAMRTS